MMRAHMTDQKPPRQLEWTTVFLCGLETTEQRPFMPFDPLLYPIPGLGQLSYTDLKGYRCPACTAADVLDHAELSHIGTHTSNTSQGSTTPQDNYTTQDDLWAWAEPSH
jgi:hypothetical protein